MAAAPADSFTLDGLIARLALERPDAPCLSFAGRTFSFAEFDRRASRAAARLMAKGVQAGDRVAIVARNGPLFFELLIGCARAGAILVPINWRLAPREIADVIADAEPRVLLTGPEERALVPTALAGVVVVDADEEHAALDRGSDGEFVTSAAATDRTVALLYTSGTTGRPKGVMITHRNFFYTQRMASEVWTFSGASVNLAAMPLFHIGGLGYGLMAMTQGGHTVLLKQLTPALVLEAIRGYAVTHAFFVPTVIQMLVDAAGDDHEGLRSLEYIVYGGAPITEVQLRRAIAVFGCGFHHAYGLTETAGTVLNLPPQDHVPERLRSCGRPVPWAEARLVDPATEREVAVGEVGEIRIRSPIVSPGYWRKPEATAETRDSEGWFRTGDAATRDENGLYYICDRYKDMIVSGGENVFPAEVENVLARHPAVAEVAVISAPHERWGETVKAVVVTREGTVLDEGDLLSFARGELARYKCPTLIEVVPALPKTASGKVLKHALRALARAGGSTGS
jgi:acyl-CoA synthetase (AMP-forming)/AMP-acid ligase II